MEHNKINMQTVEKIIKVLEVVGQGSYVEAVAGSSQLDKNSITSEEIRKAAEIFPNWLKIKEGKLFSNKNMF